MADVAVAVAAAAGIAADAIVAVVTAGAVIADLVTGGEPPADLVRAARYVRQLATWLGSER